MNEREITHYLTTDRRTSQKFRGVMAYDELPVGMAEPGLYIVNTGLSSTPGKHWVSVFLDETCEYFDSLGKPPKEVIGFINRQGKAFTYSDTRLQGGSSDVCGDYCILYAYFKCRDFTLKDFIAMFTDDYVYNDKMVEL